MLVDAKKPSFFIAAVLAKHVVSRVIKFWLIFKAKNLIKFFQFYQLLNFSAHFHTLLVQKKYWKGVKKYRKKIENLFHWKKWLKLFASNRWLIIVALFALRAIKLYLFDQQRG